MQPNAQTDTKICHPWERGGEMLVKLKRTLRHTSRQRKRFSGTINVKQL